MNRSVNYLKNDQFEETNFLNEVLDPDLIPEFKNYKVDKGEKYSIEDVTSFPMQTQQYLMHENQLKVINLDTNIQIKMDFINPESAEKYVEKAGMKKNKCTTTLFILRAKNHKSIYQ
jgi:hypothetical protein